ncbi:hypothetical protein [Wolbachia endosymbiont of Cantharis cryptica]|uniref:hypothetical protein n=1 Tax=Wolbachia endosymbiont of Cantharis cryptica TaxID=3066132 RepID=UPI00376EE06F
MPILERIASVGNEKLKQQGYSHKTEYPTKTENLQLSMVMQECVDERMRKYILDMLKKIHSLYISDQTILNFVHTKLFDGKMIGIEGCLKLTEDGKKQKIMFGVPCNIYPDLHNTYPYLETISLIDYLIKYSSLLEKNQSYIDESERHQLDSLLLKIYGLVLTCTNVSKESLNLLPKDILKKREDCLSKRRKIVCESIENGEEDGVIVETDNGRYCIECPAESVVKPATFMNSPEFKYLEGGVLQIGEGGGAVQIQYGEYRRIKGILQMTFAVGDEKIVMILYSKDPSDFGEIMVDMDGENCKLFLEPV